MQFLDTQRIDNLTAYLEALHKAQIASEDHTTLLLNCYTKRKDVSKLDEFIKVCINAHCLQLTRLWYLVRQCLLEPTD